MELELLETEFVKAERSDSFTVHSDFTAMLISSEDPEVISFHFNLFKRCKNKEFYQLLASYFGRRGVSGETFLLDVINAEDDPNLLALAIQILGTMKTDKALSISRSFLKHKEAKVRERACIVLGWVGVSDDIKLLADLQLEEKDINTRKWAASQQMQIWFRDNSVKNEIIENLAKAIELEVDEDVLGTIIVTAQEILKRKFGIREDRETRKYIGDLQIAKQKATTALRNYSKRNQN